MGKYKEANGVMGKDKDANEGVDQLKH